MTIRSMGSGSFKEEIPLELTMAEKRDLIERITELVKHDVLKRSDRDDIYRDRKSTRLNSSHAR